MTGDQYERLVKALEVLAIVAVQVGANQLYQHASSVRANDLIEATQPKLAWQVRRYT